MKKFLTTTLALILCLVPCLLFSACGGGPKALTEAEAQQELTTALANSSAKTDVQVYITSDGYSVINTAKTDMSYFKSVYDGSIVEEWVRKEGQTYYTCRIRSVDQVVESYTKTEVTQDDLDSDIFRAYSQNPFEQDGFTFVSAEVENEVTTIVVTLPSNTGTTSYTYVVSGELVESMSASAEMNGETISQTLAFKYDTDVIIPELPTVDAQNNPIVWG